MSAPTGGDTPSRRLRIALVTPWRFDDPRAWSGMIPRIHAALSGVADVIPLSTADQPTALADRLASKTLGAVSRRSYLWDFGVATAAARGRALRRRVRVVRPDVVLAVVASTDVAFLGDVGAPVVQVSDATFAAIAGFYPLFSNLHPLSSAQAEFVTERATRATDVFVASSQWAIDSLVRDYAVGTQQCVLAPTGPGIDPPEPWVRIENTSPTVEALLVASNWQRKGGDTAVEAVRQARERGTDVTLTVVGDAPTGLPAWVRARGRLDATELSAEYLRADVLVELADANAAGVTLTDAAAHGVPAVATDVGGVASIIENGVTGILIDPSGGAADVAARAADALTRLRDPALRTSLAAAARERWHNELTWDEWTKRTLAACVQAVDSREMRRK